MYDPMDEYYLEEDKMWVLIVLLTQLVVLLIWILHSTGYCRSHRAIGDIRPHRSIIVYRIRLNLTTSDILGTTLDLPNELNKF